MFSCRKDVYCDESFFLLYQCAQCTGTNMPRTVNFRGPKHHGKCQPGGDCNPACAVLAAKHLLTNNKSLKSREDNEGEELTSTDDNEESQREKPKKRKEPAAEKLNEDVVVSTTKKSKKKQTKEAAASESQEAPGSEVDLQSIESGQ